MANYAEIDFIVESDDYLKAPEGDDINRDTAMALACDLSEMCKHCNSDDELFHLASKYFGDRPGVMDKDVKKPELQAQRTVIQHHLFMVLAYTAHKVGFEADDVALNLQWNDNKAGCRISIGMHKRLGPKRTKLIGKILSVALNETINEINGDYDYDTDEIDDDVARALEAIGWDKQSKGEA